MNVLPTAYLIHENTVYYAREKAPLSALFPFTPVTQLIEGIWNEFSDQALKILRNRIYTTSKLTPLCDGMIKVAAKRCSEISTLPEDLFSRYPVIEILPPPLFNKNEPSFIAKRITAQLFSPEQKELGIEENSNKQNRVQHAELKLVRRYLAEHQQKIPAHCKIMISLKPCAMCAAQIFTFAEDPSTLEIVYEEDDPGPMAGSSLMIEGTHFWERAGRPKISLRLKVVT